MKEREEKQKTNKHIVYCGSFFNYFSLFTMDQLFIVVIAHMVVLKMVVAMEENSHHA